VRGIFGIVSLLVIGVAAAFYFTSAQPELTQPGQYQKLQSKVDATVKLMQHDPQADLDAASRTSSPATNTPAPGN
jgi:hypothetical protein